jgi:hypothetical protein
MVNTSEETIEPPIQAPYRRSTAVGAAVTRNFAA